MRSRTAISERRTCWLVGISLSVLRYLPEQSVEERQLSGRIVDLVQQRRSFGYRRIHALLRRDGIEINHKRLYRLYRSEGLTVKRRGRRKGVAVQRHALEVPSRPNEVWSMYFVMDALVHGRRLKMLTIVDDFTRESIDVVVDRSICIYVARVLDRAVLLRGTPRAIRIDQGPEFTSKALDQWAYERGLELRLIQSGKLTQNAFIESFNGWLRDECLTEHWFTDLAHARDTVAQWRCDYNHHRPQSALGYQTPADYAEQSRAEPLTVNRQQEHVE